MNVFGAADTNKATYVFYDIDAKEVNLDRKTGITVLKGEVKVHKRDSGDHLNADQVTIYRDVEKDELIKIEAVGKVDMKEKDLIATSEHAIIYEKEERIELEGSPAMVDDGKNKIEAPAIIYFRKENRLEAKGKVTASITIEEKKSETEETAGKEKAK